MDLSDGIALTKVFHCVGMEPPRQGAAEAGAQRWATRTEVAEETFQGVDPGAITGCQEKVLKNWGGWKTIQKPWLLCG